MDLRYTCIPQNISQTCRENCKKDHYKESLQDISLSVSLSYSLLLLFYVLLWELLLVHELMNHYYVPHTELHCVTVYFLIALLTLLSNVY